MLGISERSTMDMDVTVRGIDMDESTISKTIQDILDIDGDDGISFVFKKIEPIREDDEYSNFRIHFNAVFGKINNPMKLDITTGDVITPNAIEYSYKSLFDDKAIPIMAYNAELNDALDIISEIRSEKYLKDLWDNYSASNAYSAHISFNNMVDNLLDVAVFLS